MFLELATTSGAVVGALLAAVVAPALLYVTLGVVLILSAALQLTRCPPWRPSPGTAEDRNPVAAPDVVCVRQVAAVPRDG